MTIYPSKLSREYPCKRRCLHHARTILLLSSILLSIQLSAEPVAVRYREGSVHGYLALRTLQGDILAAGDLTQVIHGGQAISHLVFHFKDGSIDEERAVFTQNGNFRLISDHHVQKGPIFPRATDMSIDASTGQVTVRYQEKGQEKVETSHLDLPSDLANGIIINVLKNIPPGVQETKQSYLAATPKLRLVHLSVIPQGEETFSIADAPHQATCFKVKIDLGGVGGVIAPLIGKQPTDIKVWVAHGGAPAFVKSEGSLYLGGPIWRIEMTSPVWRGAPSTNR